MEIQVTCPINRMRDLILNNCPEYYGLNEQSQTEVVRQFVKPVDENRTFQYMADHKADPVEGI